MLAHLRLGTKFTLLLSAVFVVGIGVGGAALWSVLEQKAQNEITAKGLLLIETMNSVRHYTSNHIQPLLRDDLAAQPEFIPESVPAFSARSVFERLRQYENYADYRYKEATLNPTNPLDRADDFETTLVSRFRQDPALTQITDYHAAGGQRMFYVARPLAVTAESCLVCHSTPATAPASLIRSYGAEGGFGWGLNEIVAAQVVYVPAGEVFNVALRSFLTVMGIFLGLLAWSLLVINFLLKRYVLSPIQVIDGLARRVSADTLSEADLKTESVARIAARGDELGQMGRVFRQMAKQVFERTEHLRQQVEMLNIEIDEIKKQRHVREVVDTEFFRDLQARAAEMRAHRKSRPLPKATR